KEDGEIDPTESLSRVRSAMNPKLSKIIGVKNAEAVVSPRHSEQKGNTAKWFNFKIWWPLLKDTAEKWSADKAPRLGAALSYYTVFSLVPLLILTIAILGLAFGREAGQ